MCLAYIIWLFANHLILQCWDRTGARFRGNTSDKSWEEVNRYLKNFETRKGELGM